MSAALDRFRGDAAWVHALEGSGLDYFGRSCYWPHGASGVTLDPGVDLGYVDADLFASIYRGRLTDEQFAACRRVLGVRGREAQHRIAASPVLRSIRISKEVAEEIFPVIAAPYWRAIAQRFPAALAADAPAALHTVLLSLSYNRGPHNEDLDVLAEPIARGDWRTVADCIERMQDHHDLEGIRERRDQEGRYLDHALDRRAAKLERLAGVLRHVAAAPAAPLPTTDLDWAPDDLAT